MRHPEHEHIAREVASWYELAYPEMGYQTEKRPHGWYRTNTAAPDWGSVTVTALRATEVPAFVADVKTSFGGRSSVSIEVPDQAYTPEAADALKEAGWTYTRTTVFLAYVGDGPIAAMPDGVEIADADDPPTLEVWARTKLMGFDDSEDEPSREGIDAELRQRSAEAGGSGRFLLARVENEPAAICGLHDENERFVFLLATRVPYRHRGIARALLEHIRAPAGARATLINATEGGRPDALYRSLGFTDVVHRRHEFRRP
jgi:GNAT superfamily N-acetyltransferase